MPRIAISYRRADSEAITGRIFDRLVARYGRESIFRDIDNIPLGIDFREHIGAVLDQTDILLVVIGPRWLGRHGGQSRIHDPADFVRIEVETALSKGIPVVPIPVGRTNLPKIEELPASLQLLLYRNGMRVDAGQDFDAHVARLIRAMDLIQADSSKVSRTSELPEAGGSQKREAPLFQGEREHEEEPVIDAGGQKEARLFQQKKEQKIEPAPETRQEKQERLGQEEGGPQREGSAVTNPQEAENKEELQQNMVVSEYNKNTKSLFLLVLQLGAGSIIGWFFAFIAVVFSWLFVGISFKELLEDDFWRALLLLRMQQCVWGGVVGAVVILAHSKIETRFLPTWVWISILSVPITYVLQYLSWTHWEYGKYLSSLHEDFRIYFPVSIIWSCTTPYLLRLLMSSLSRKLGQRETAGA